MKLIHFSGAFAAYRAVRNMCEIGMNPAAALQIGGPSHASFVADSFAVLMQEIGAFRAKSEIGLLGEKGGISEGKIKETGTTLAGFQKLSLSAHCLGEPRTAPHF